MSCWELSQPHAGYSQQDLLDAIPGFVESLWPKNDTAAAGGLPTPGRGEAAVILTRFVMTVTTGSS